jgi:hypothetical protein
MFIIKQQHALADTGQRTVSHVGHVKRRARIRHETMLTAPPTVEEFDAFHRNRRFITVITRAPGGLHSDPHESTSQSHARF